MGSSVYIFIELIAIMSSVAMVCYSIWVMYVIQVKFPATKILSKINAPPFMVLLLSFSYSVGSMEWIMGGYADELEDDVNVFWACWELGVFIITYILLDIYFKVIRRKKIS